MLFREPRTVVGLGKHFLLSPPRRGWDREKFVTDRAEFMKLVMAHRTKWAFQQDFARDVELIQPSELDYVEIDKAASEIFDAEIVDWDNTGAKLQSNALGEWQSAEKLAKHTRMLLLLPRIGEITLALHGTYDKVHPIEAARSMASTLQCKLVEFGTGHNLPYGNDADQLWLGPFLAHLEETESQLAAD